MLFFLEFHCSLGASSMCSYEWPGSLKCLATGLDSSDPLFFTSSKRSEIFRGIFGSCPFVSSLLTVNSETY